MFEWVIPTIIAIVLGAITFYQTYRNMELKKLIDAPDIDFDFEIINPATNGKNTDNGQYRIMLYRYNDKPIVEGGFRILSGYNKKAQVYPFKIK